METTTQEQQSTMRIGVLIAIGAAVLAVLLSILALGRALSTDTGTTGGVAIEGGGTGGGADSDQPAIVGVTLSDFAIDPTPLEVAPGTTLAVTNDGGIAHNLKLKDVGLGTSDIAGGGSENLDISSLSPGTYTMFCDIAGHEAAGMVGTLVIGQSGGGEPVAVDGGEQLTGEARAEWLRANYEASVAAFPAETEGLGSAFMEPEVLPDGTKLFELVLDEAEWEVAPGEFVEAVAYNGIVPGPSIRTEVGDTVTIRVVNNLDDQATTLHPHGIFMHPFEVDGVGYVSHDPTMPGETDEWTFETKEPSIGMYHGHDNGVHQVINGAFGAFIVGEIARPAEADNIVAEDVMILNDAGEIGLTLNGKSFPATKPYVLNKGEQMVMHYYNEGLTPHPMHLHNNAQLVYAKDGYPLEVPYFADTVNVAPGERYSVVIFAEVPGTWVYHCHILSHVEKDDGSVFGMFTALIVEDSGDPELDADTGRQAGNRSEDGGDGEAEEPAADTDPEATEEEAAGDA